MITSVATLVVMVVVSISLDKRMNLLSNHYSSPNGSYLVLIFVNVNRTSYIASFPPPLLLSSHLFWFPLRVCCSGHSKNNEFLNAIFPTYFYPSTLDASVSRLLERSSLVYYLGSLQHTPSL